MERTQNTCEIIENQKEKLLKIVDCMEHNLFWNADTHKREKIYYKEDLFFYKILPCSTK
jgi:hypothetical protein